MKNIDYYCRSHDSTTTTTTTTTTTATSFGFCLTFYLSGFIPGQAGRYIPFGYCCSRFFIGWMPFFSFVLTVLLKV